jgi:hypothetical protein
MVFTVSLYCYLFEAGALKRILLWAVFGLHWGFSKTIKLLPHLYRNPSDVRFVLVSILFGYFHNLIKLYGLITIREVCWPLPARSAY